MHKETSGVRKFQYILQHGVICIFSHPTHLYIARRLCAIVWRERDRDAEGASFEDIVQELVGQVEFFNSQRNRCFLWSIDWRAHF